MSIRLEALPSPRLRVFGSPIQIQAVRSLGLLVKPRYHIPHGQVAAHSTVRRFRGTLMRQADVSREEVAVQLLLVTTPIG